MLSSRHKREVVETFVSSELLKHISYSELQPQLYHYRTADKKEIDFVIEKHDQIIAIEVKSSQSIKQNTFRHITEFQEKSNKPVLGIVLYTGEHVLSFGDDEYSRYAVPLNVFF